MKIQCLSLLSGVVCFFAGTCWLQADQLEMQNGDRYFGKVLAVSSDTVTMDSEILGKIKVPRKLVASLLFGTNSAVPVAADIGTRVPAPANSPAMATTVPPANVANTNVNLAAAFQKLGVNHTNFVGQIRDQMLAGSPEAGAKYDEMVNGLMSGSMNLNDLRSQAKASADQLRELKRELGPDADESLDAYLEVLDNFIKETDNGSAGINSASQTGAHSP